MRKNVSEHAMGADAGAPGCVGAERHPTLPEEKEESAETRGGNEGAGALVENVKRRG